MNNKISFETLFTTYWPQLTLLFALVSYFFNRTFNMRDKRIELRSSLFEEQRMNAIGEFLDTYIEIEFVFTQLDYRGALSFEMTAKELDSIVFPSYNKFTSAYYKLFFLLTEGELKEFTIIFDSIVKVKNTLGNLRHSYSDEKNDLFNRTETYISLAYDTARENKRSLKRIGEQFRREYL